MSEPAKTSDLQTRVISGVVMIALALGLLWIGGIPWLIGTIVLGGVVLMEFAQLVDKFPHGAAAKWAWKGFGLFYVSGAVWALFQLRERAPGGDGFWSALGVLALVWAVDIGAYFTGRTVGGPKIMPSVSPSKTWSGLAGGSLAAGLLLIFYASQSGLPVNVVFIVILTLLGALVAVIAQTGDFFESWMKRRAGVKDSGSLIPGHGGVFDRVDGLIPVVILFALLGMMIGG